MIPPPGRRQKMDRTQIIDTIKDLACSQGFYGRLLEQLCELPEEDYNNVMEDLEAQHFNDTLDLVLYLEC